MLARKKRNSSKINLIISAIFHTLLIAAVFFFAAKEGLVGKKLQTIAVTMLKEKKIQPPKEKLPEPPKQEAPKTEPHPMTASIPQPQAAPPPAAAAAGLPAAAPEAVQLASFQFDDGAKAVETITDPKSLYKASVEHAFLSRWNRPEDIADDSYVAMVDLSITPEGKVQSYQWLSGSGDERWDNSVKEALSEVKVLNHRPPKGFPTHFNLRFDVESQRTESVLQVSSR